MNRQVKRCAVFLVMFLVLQVMLGNLGSSIVQAADESVLLYLNRTSFTNGSVYIQVHTDSSLKVKSILIQKGSVSKTTASAWKNASDITTSKKLKVSQNATYSVKVTDKSGKAVIRKIAVTNIDKKVPTVSLSQENASGGVKVTVKASDTSGVKTIKWVKGSIDDANSSQFDRGTDITKTKNFLAASNGYYSVQVTDAAGNKAVKKIWATTVQQLNDLKPSTGEDCGVENKNIKDIYGNLFSDGLLMTWSSNVETEYVNPGYGKLTGTIMVSSESYDHFEGQLKIYADDELVYSISLTKKSVPVELELDITGVTFVRIEKSDPRRVGKVVISNAAFRN